MSLMIKKTFRCDRKKKAKDEMYEGRNTFSTVQLIPLLVTFKSQIKKKTHKISI